MPYDGVGPVQRIGDARPSRAKQERIDAAASSRHKLAPVRGNRAARARAIDEVWDRVVPFLEGERANLQAIENRLAQSLEHEPRPVGELPVFSARESIIARLRDSRRALLVGETGSGKTLLAPFLAMQAGLGRRGMIAHTQPRRVAARSIARRLAQMSGTKVGELFGVHTRFDRSLSRDTVVKVCTDGILLQELKDDPYLSRYEALILDEAHERNLNIDLALGMIRRLLEKRDDLTVLVMSATIDEAKFARFLGIDDKDVLRVEGRLYPVETRYDPVPEQPVEWIDAFDRRRSAIGEHERLALHTAEIVKRLTNETAGDVLIFMPRVKEILTTLRALRRTGLSNCDLLPMHGKLSPDENDRVFAPSERRKIVVATNIAETSITVPGIRAVVDSGLVNLKRYNARTGITVLRPEPAARASAQQRQGRAGRLEEGVCVRLYDGDDFEQRPAFTEPEIRREDLAHTVLYMRVLGIDDIEAFPFLDRPDQNQLADAHRTLVELGAFGPPPAYAVTPLGRRMAALPLEPRLARMVLAAERFGCVEEILTVAACLSVDKEPFVIPSGTDPRQGGIEAARRLVNEKKREFAGGTGSDVIALLNVFRSYVRTSWRGGEREAFCERHRLSIRVLEEIRVIRQDLVDALGGGRDRSKKKESGGGGARRRDGQSAGDQVLVQFSSSPDNPAAVGKAVLAGLVQNLCVHTAKYEYLAQGKHTAFLHPGSVLFHRETMPDLVVALELTRGEHKTYARQLTEVPIDWLYEVVPHVLSYHHDGVRFDEESGKVLAELSVYFHEATLIEGDTVELADREPDRALDVLVRDGLVPGKLGIERSFLIENEHVLAEARSMAARVRRTNPEVVERALSAFYIEELNGCRDRADVQARVKRRGGTSFLCVTLDHLLDPHEQDRASEDFPEKVVIGGAVCDVVYVTSPVDGQRSITLVVREDRLHRLTENGVDRAIPGLVAERLTRYRDVFNAAAAVHDVALAGAARVSDGDLREMTIATRREPLLATRDAFRGWLLVHRGLELPDAFLDESDKIAREAGAWPMVEVRRDDGTAIARGTDLLTLAEQVAADRRRRAWAAARRRYETEPTAAYETLPGLFEAAGTDAPAPLSRVVVLAEGGPDGEDVAGFVGVERSAFGRLGLLRRALFTTHRDALSATAAAIAQFGYLKLMLRPALLTQLERLGASIDDAVEERYYHITGLTASLAEQVRDWLIDPVWGAFAEDESDDDDDEPHGTPTTWVTAEALAAGSAAIESRVASWLEALPARIGDAIALVSAVCERFDALRRRLDSGKLPVGPATSTSAEELLDRVRVMLHELPEQSYRQVAGVLAALDAIDERIVEEGQAARKAERAQQKQREQARETEALHEAAQQLLEANRRQLDALIAREARAASATEAAVALAQQVVRELASRGTLGLDLSVPTEWDESAANDAQQEHLLAVYELVEHWLTAAATTEQALPEASAEKRVAHAISLIN